MTRVTSTRRSADLQERGTTAGHANARPGNSNAVSHGAHSERRVKPLATVQKRRFLRQNGLRKADVDGVGLALLDAWARAQAKVELLDAFFADRGIVDPEDGRPAPALAVYFTALNAATKALGRLDDHLKARAETDPFEALSAHVVELRRAADG
jgi:hypothetical protein